MSENEQPLTAIAEPDPVYADHRAFARIARALDLPVEYVDWAGLGPGAVTALDSDCYCLRREKKDFYLSLSFGLAAMAGILSTAAAAFMREPLWLWATAGLAAMNTFTLGGSRQYAILMYEKAVLRSALLHTACTNAECPPPELRYSDDLLHPFSVKDLIKNRHIQPIHRMMEVYPELKPAMIAISREIHALAREIVERKGKSGELFVNTEREPGEAVSAEARGETADTGAAPERKKGRAPEPEPVEDREMPEEPEERPRKVNGARAADPALPVGRIEPEPVPEPVPAPEPEPAPEPAPEKPPEDFDAKIAELLGQDGSPAVKTGNGGTGNGRTFRKKRRAPGDRQAPRSP